ncbi:unnamed protein product [Adineta steineri]|uniref:BTB domain-containing protein n=1 Tax=Adineta steineri TaxID=433720 RepID=A0A815SQL7_9BILA|nr:unnamed protein product [Adineta steineri]
MKSNLDTIQDITTIKGKIILDVRGVKYTTSVNTLTRKKDTFFTALFSGRWELERDSNDNSIFIGRDGDLFKYILSYLRTDKIHNTVMTDETLRRRLIIEADYFCLHNLNKEDDQSTLPISNENNFHWNQTTCLATQW